LANGYCEDFVVPVTDAFSEMELAYTCYLKCESGTAYIGEERESLAEGIQMKCRNRDLIRPRMPLNLLDKSRTFLRFFDRHVSERTNPISNANLTRFKQSG
jgi:hypothetical protein